MKTRTTRRAISGLVRAGVALAAVANLAGVTLPALADGTGTCPGVDLVETNLTNGTSSGYFIPGLKLIILNRAILVKYAPSVQQFILAHEYAHANPAVGEDESKADCAATKQGTKEGWLTAPDLIKVCVHFSHFPPDATHPPIQARCANIRRCAQEAEPVMAQSQAPEKERARTPLMARNFARNFE